MRLAKSRMWSTFVTRSASIPQALCPECGTEWSLQWLWHRQRGPTHRAQASIYLSACSFRLRIQPRGGHSFSSYHRRPRRYLAGMIAACALLQWLSSTLLLLLYEGRHQASQSSPVISSNGPRLFKQRFAMHISPGLNEVKSCKTVKYPSALTIFFVCFLDTASWKQVTEGFSTNIHVTARSSVASRMLPRQSEV